MGRYTNAVDRITPEETAKLEELYQQEGLPFNLASLRRLAERQDALEEKVENALAFLDTHPDLEKS